MGDCVLDRYFAHRRVDKVVDHWKVVWILKIDFYPETEGRAGKVVSARKTKMVRGLVSILAFNKKRAAVKLSFKPLTVCSIIAKLHSNTERPEKGISGQQ